MRAILLILTSFCFQSLLLSQITQIGNDFDANSLISADNDGIAIASQTIISRYSDYDSLKFSINYYSNGQWDIIEKDIMYKFYRPIVLKSSYKTKLVGKKIYVLSWAGFSDNTYTFKLLTNEGKRLIQLGPDYKLKSGLGDLNVDFELVNNVPIVAITQYNNDKVQVLTLLNNYWQDLGSTNFEEKADYYHYLRLFANSTGIYLAFSTFDPGGIILKKFHNNTWVNHFTPSETLASVYWAGRESIKMFLKGSQPYLTKKPSRVNLDYQPLVMTVQENIWAKLTGTDPRALKDCSSIPVMSFNGMQDYLFFLFDGELFAYSYTNEKWVLNAKLANTSSYYIHIIDVQPLGKDNYILVRFNFPGSILAPVTRLYKFSPNSNSCNDFKFIDNSDMLNLCKNDLKYSAELSGGSPPYQYRWSNGSTNSSIQNIPPGLYGVTVTDAANCSISKTITVDKIEKPIISIRDIRASDCKTPNGFATASVTQGKQPYKYRWTNNQTTNILSNVAPGIYGLTVSDAQGCDATVGITIPANVNIPSSLSASNLQVNSAVVNWVGNADRYLVEYKSISQSTWLSLGVFTSTSAQLNNLSPGTSYEVRVVANCGETISSASSIFTFKTLSSPTNRLPVVKIISPANGARFPAPASFTVEAEASDPDGNIAKVEFYINDRFVGSDSEAPFIRNFTLNEGTYTLTAKAIDNQQASTLSSPVSITVTKVGHEFDEPCGKVLAINTTCAWMEANNTGARPSTGINSSCSTSSTGKDIWFQFVAPSSGKIIIETKAGTLLDGVMTLYLRKSSCNELQEVTCQDDPASGGLMPYLEATLIPGQAYLIRFWGYDGSEGNFQLCVRSVATNQLPYVSIISPGNNSSFNAPASFSLEVDAYDPDGSISKVEFFLNGNLLSTDSQSPYSYPISNLSAGSYSLSAKAYDNQGGTATSSTHTITVINNTNPDDEPCGKMLTLSSELTYYNATNSRATYSSSVGTNGLCQAIGTVKDVWFQFVVPKAGKIILQALPGTMSDGVMAVYHKQSTCTFLQPPIACDDDSGEGLMPKLELNNLIVGQTYLIRFWGHNSTEGTFRLGIQQEESLCPGIFDLVCGSDGKEYQSPCHAERAGVSWRRGACSAANLLPTVSVTAPSNNSTFNAPATINITASANDPDGSISKVELYVNDRLQGSDFEAPYSFSITFGEGNHVLKVKAIDNLQAFTFSNPISVTVAAVNQTPYISITTPGNNSTFNAPATFSIEADAYDPDGSISKVEFFLNGALRGTDSQMPYAYAVSNLSAGTYTLSAKAYDNRGSTATSSTHTITVINNTNPDDEPCGKVLTLSSELTYYSATNSRATYSSSVGTNGLCQASGTVKDVWFQFVVPKAGKIILQALPGTMNNGVMAVYHKQSTCTFLQPPIACDDDSGEGLMPKLELNNLIAGQTYLIRFWGHNSTEGTFRLGIQQEDCSCIGIYDPVCGSDGKNYSSPCQAECAGVRWEYGNCASTPPPPTSSNNALVLNGSSDYKEVGSSIFQDIRSFTIETWARFNSPGSGNNDFIAEIGNSSFTKLWFWYNNDNTFGLPSRNIAIGFNGAQGGYNGGPDFLYSFTPQAGTWYHLAYTFDYISKRITLYVNGASQGSRAVSGSLPSTAQSGMNLNIGRRIFGGVNNHFFDGQLDEFRVWDYARSSTEIAQNYQTELSGTESGLICNYKFDNSVDTDCSRNGLSLRGSTRSPQSSTITNLRDVACGARFTDADIELQIHATPPAIVSIFPNPTSGLTNVDVRSNQGVPQDWIITDLHGRTLKQIHRRPEATNMDYFSLDLGDLGSGMYLLTTKIEGKMVTYRVSVVR